MTNKQLYNIVFERFIQAKKELIREGYHKTSVDKVDFNEVFNGTKHALQEAKIKSLMRENQMLKKKLKQEGLLGNMSGTGGSETGGFGSKTVGNFMNKVGADVFKHKGSIATIEAEKLDKVFDKMAMEYNTSKQGLVDAFEIKMIRNLENGMSKNEAIKSAMADMGGTLAESRRRKLQKEGLFDMFGKKGGQPQTQQREPKQVWLETLTKVFGSDFVKQNLSKMDDKSLSDFFKPINNLFLEGGGGPIFSGLMDILERTKGVDFKNLNQDYFAPLSSQLMLLNQFMNLFKIIETKFGNMENTMITSLYKSNVTNPTQKEVLSQLVKKSKESGRPISEVLGLISTYAKPSPQNLAENKRRRY
jgi:hypothetical protein